MEVLANPPRSDDVLPLFTRSDTAEEARCIAAAWRAWRDPDAVSVFRSAFGRLPASQVMVLATSSAVTQVNLNIQLPPPPPP
jgi:hypothetical protein